MKTTMTMIIWKDDFEQFPRLWHLLWNGVEMARFRVIRNIPKLVEIEGERGDLEALYKL